MQREDAYELIADYQPKTVRFRFTSVGDKGSIEKIIEFSLTPENYWNLGFGDLVGDDWEDNVISNNNDFRTVLQTVANAVHQFCEMYPQQQILIRPLDYQRKLLYNRIFQQKWLEIEPLFIVKGVDISSVSPYFENYNPRIRFDYFVIERKV
jgi:hypothetical protein